MPNKFSAFIQISKPLPCSWRQKTNSPIQSFLMSLAGYICMNQLFFAYEMPKTKRNISLTNQHRKLCINKNNQIINFSPNLVWTPQLLQLVSMYAFFSRSTRHTIWKMAYHGTTRRFERNMPILFLTLSKNMHQVFRDTHKIESWKKLLCDIFQNVSKHYCT